MALIEVKNLSKVFDNEGVRTQALENVNFSIGKGEFVAIMGPSGAGKSTLLQILGGLDNATSGSIEISGKAISGMPRAELAMFRNKQIGFVFQFHHLLPDFTAIENVILPGLIGGKSKEECLPRGRELLGIFNLDKRTKHYPAELSGGERQRIALARALYNEPALVLADEPTGNLDRENSRILLELFIKANVELNQTFLVATHNPELSGGMRRNLYMEDGKIISHD